MKSGFFGLVRNGFVSLSSIFTMVVTLAVIVSLMFGSAILSTTLAALKDKVDLNVYFVIGSEEADILAIKKTLETLPEVRSVEYISEEQALINFREKHKDDQTTLQALEELDYNPLGAALNVKAEEPSQYEGVSQFLSQTENITAADGSVLVDKINYLQNKTVIDRLSRLIGAAETAGFIATIILVIISVLITFNTVRLVIFMSKDEISVMRLVGASSFYVRGPFMVTGLLYGVAAGLITLILVYPVTLSLSSLTENFFIGFNLFDYFISNFAQFFLVVIGSGLLIGAVSSYLAVRKYLKL